MSLLGFLAFGPLVADLLGSLARYHFLHLHEFDVSVSTLPGLAKGWILTYGQAAAFPAFIACIAGVCVAVLQVGWKPSGKPLEVKWERFNLVKGLGRLFGGRSFVQLVRDLIKISLLATTAYVAIKGESGHFAMLADISLSQSAAMLGGMALRVGFKITGALLIIAIADYAYQRFDYERNLRMTRQQVKEESKQLEGDPQIKARIRKIQRDLSRKRMMDDVATADLVVTTPGHLSVALRYNREHDCAPVVVAKGADSLANRIQDMAREPGIPVIDNSVLAGSLYRSVKVGTEIPEQLYASTAGALAMALQTRGAARS
jgi:flagellar biosynthetic protein FlhB